MRLSSFAIHHSAIIIILGLAVIIFGIISLSTLNQEFLPDVSIPSIMILTQYPGVDAQKVEEVSETIEEAMVTLQGLKNISSQSRNSMSVVTLEFSSRIDPFLILPDVRASIDRVKGSLPDGIESDPYAFVGGSGMLSIYSFAVISDRNPDSLFRFVEEEITPSISRIPGTAGVYAYGGREQEVSITLDTKVLKQLGISVLEVYQILSASNITLPSGTPTYRDSQIYFSVEGTYTSLRELEDLVIGFKNNSYIYLSDIAEIKKQYPSEELFIEVDGKRAIVIDVTKRGDGNTIKIIEEIERIIRQYDRQYEGVISFEEIQNDSSFITQSLSTTIRSGLIGAAMAVLVILIFIGDMRATLIIGVSIPLSIVFAFIGMKFAGQSINILSLSGLIVALGMVVDSSIVILENIFRYEHAGYNVVEAAEKGTDEVGGAVFASGATTIAVFIPLLVLTGIIGIIMTDISLTIIFALAASLLVSLVVVPFLATHLKLEREAVAQDTKKRFDMMEKVEAVYRLILSWSIRHKSFIILVTIVILLLSFLAISVLGVVFIPSADTGDFYVYLKFPQGYHIEQTHEKVALVQQLIEDSVPEIDHSTFFTGFSNEFSRSYSIANRAYAKILLIDSDERERDIKEIITRLQSDIITTVPDVDVIVENGGFDKLIAIASGGSGFQVELYGNDLDDLFKAAEEVRVTLEADSQIHKAVLNIQEDQETLITDLALDHMGRLGISAQEAAFTSRILFNGIEIGSFTDTNDRDYPIRLKSELATEPMTLHTLEQISIPSMQGAPISFESFSETHVDTSVSTINHKNRMKSIIITGYSITDDTSMIRTHMEDYLSAGTIDPSIQWKISGTSSLLSESLSTLLLVLVVAVFLVYMVMVIQFERFIQPLIIMVSVPFCFIGVILGLLLFGSDLSLIAFLGIIALAGIVVNNAIVLIDRMNHGQEKDLDLRIINGAVTRLRPVLMTTLTTLFGVLPMAMSRGGGSEVYAPLGQAIAGGLITSTSITLILIPVLYAIISKEEKTDEIQE